MDSSNTSAHTFKATIKFLFLLCSSVLTSHSSITLLLITLKRGRSRLSFLLSHKSSLQRMVDPQDTVVIIYLVEMSLQQTLIDVTKKIGKEFMNLTIQKHSIDHNDMSKFQISTITNSRVMAALKSNFPDINMEPPC